MLCDCQLRLNTVVDGEVYLVGPAVLIVVDNEAHGAPLVLLSVLALVIDSQLIET